MRLPVAREFIPVHVLQPRIVWRMASRKGIEPLTPGLGNLCSILLSYRDLDQRAAARLDRCRRTGRERAKALAWILALRTAFANNLRD